ncbi:MAG TPA: hypothetical protein VMT69_13100 [Kineosporiaceae bacterium]|nr:hypothetical protein [Kineosporiaceae bacterium]
MTAQLLGRTRVRLVTRIPGRLLSALPVHLPVHLVAGAVRAFVVAG